MPRTATRPHRTGARERLSREAVITAALALADREGLDAVTIRRLATETGVTPMALYWHVKDKDELLQGLGELLFAEVVLPAPSRRVWHAQLQLTLAALLVPMRRHPAAAPLALTTVLDCEPGLVVAERVLALLTQGGYGPDEAAETGYYLLGALVAMVTLESRAAMVAEEHDELSDVKQGRLASLSPQWFPHVVRLAAELTGCGTRDSYFDRGLALLVHGTRGLAGS